MGRNKPRSKAVDVTKSLLQPTSITDHIAVQIGPNAVLQVAEDDLSPTQGSEAAFALRREGKLDASMKLCLNWRQGNCHNHAACSFAHVLRYFGVTGDGVSPLLSSKSNGPGGSTYSSVAARGANSNSSANNSPGSGQSNAAAVNSSWSQKLAPPSYPTTAATTATTATPKASTVAEARVEQSTAAATAAAGTPSARSPTASADGAEAAKEVAPAAPAESKAPAAAAVHTSSNDPPPTASSAAPATGSTTAATAKPLPASSPPAVVSPEGLRSILQSLATSLASSAPAPHPSEGAAQDGDSALDAQTLSPGAALEQLAAANADAPLAPWQVANMDTQQRMLDVLGKQLIGDVFSPETTTDASDLPQLVRLNELMRAEETAAESTTAVPVPPPPSSVPSTIAPAPAAAAAVEVSDHTALGFLLGRCATADERLQCPFLGQMHSWLLQEDSRPSTAKQTAVSEENAADAGELNASVVPLSKPTEVETKLAEPVDDPAAPADVIVQKENAASPVVSLPPSAAAPSAAFAVMDIPVPILPGAGDWRGSITVHASPPPLPVATAVRSGAEPPTQQLPSTSPLMSEGTAAFLSDNSNLSPPREAAARYRMEDRDASEAESTRAPSAAETSSQSAGAAEERPTHSGSTPPPPPASYGPPQRAAHEAKTSPSEAPLSQGAAAITVPHTNDGPRFHPHVPSYAGRMPCPANEALAVRNSATVRLLSGTAGTAATGTATAPTTRPSSSTPPASRPMSGFARKFMADLYERVSTPRGGAAGSATLHSRGAVGAALLPCATGSGVRAARGRSTPQDQHRQPSPPPESPPATEAWQTSVNAALNPNAARGSLPGRSLRVRGTPSRPSRFAPTPPPSPAVRGTAAAVPERRQHQPPMHPAATTLFPGTGVTRPALRGHSAAQRHHDGASAATGPDALGLMVVGARIRLPSVAPTRPRYT